MARIRTIKPEFWTDGDMLKLSIPARLFYIGLWNFADDNGVLEYDTITLKARVFPVDRVDINRLLTELSKIGKVLTYDVENKSYLLLKNLVNHQVIDRKRKSLYPLPEGYQLKSIEISSGREGKGREGKEALHEIPPTPKNKFLEFVLLTQKEHELLIQDLGEDTTKDYIERLNNYIGSKGREYKSHYHAIKTWYRKDHPQTEHNSIIKKPI